MKNPWDPTNTSRWNHRCCLIIWHKQINVPCFWRADKRRGRRGYPCKTCDGFRVSHENFAWNCLQSPGYHASWDSNTSLTLKEPDFSTQWKIWPSWDPVRMVSCLGEMIMLEIQWVGHLLPHRTIGTVKELGGACIFGINTVTSSPGWGERQGKQLFKMRRQSKSKKPPFLLSSHQITVSVAAWWPVEGSPR